MRFLARALVPLVLLVALPGVAVAHELFDHQAPALGPQPNPVQQAQSGPADEGTEEVDGVRRIHLGTEFCCEVRDILAVGKEC